VNHARFLKEDHLSDWGRRGNKVTKGDRLDLPALVFPQAGDE